MKGGRRLLAVAPHPGEDGGLSVCIDIPGLNRVASLERLWPSRVGRCGGPPHSYVRMPYGLPNAAATYQQWLPIQARMVGCAFASMYQGSTEPHLKSASGLHAWGVVRVHLTAMLACLSACRMQLPLTSAC